VFGPYPDAHLSGYIREGRLQARTLVASSARGPFVALAEHPEWAESFVAAVLRPVTEETPEPARPAAYASQTSRRAAAAPERTVAPPLATVPTTDFAEPDVVETWAEALEPRPAPMHAAPIAATTSAPASDVGAEPAQFFVLCEGGPEAISAVASALSDLGPTAPATGASWFLAARTTADALRNALTRRAPPNARLVILDLSRNDAAWFNLGANRDGAIRRLRPPPAHPPRG
jgi:hypothetical protein